MNPPAVPPVPGPGPASSEEKAFAHHAATGSVIAPLVVLVAGVALQAVSHSGSLAPGIKALVGLVGGVILVLGLILAIIGLAGIQQHGASGLLGKSLAGLVLNGVFLAIVAAGFFAGFNKGLKSRKAKQDLQVAVRDLQSALRNSFDPEKGITNSSNDQLEEFQRQFRAASSNLTGDEALMAQATGAHIERMHLASRELQAAVEELSEAHILDFSDVTDIEQLHSRRRIVAHFAEVNQKMIGVISNAESLYRGDLNRLGISPAMVQQAMTGFRSGAVRRNALLMQIRADDSRMAKAMTSILDLLEANWGHWKTTESGTVLFTKSGLLDTYNGYVHEVQAAGEDQVNAQRKIINLHN